MDTAYQGYIGETKAMAHFASLGYYIFTDLCGTSPVDFLIMKDGEVKKVQVKTTITRSRADTGWQVQLKGSKSSNVSNRTKPFDNTAQDFLVVYLPIVDKLVVLESKNITQTSTMLLADKE